MQRYSLIHPRCGTAFLLWVMVIGVFVFAFFGRLPWYWLIATRIAFLPVIAGIAYELIRFAGKHADNRALMILLAPGLWLQRLTTREPELDQLEVSIRALREVLDREGALTPGRPSSGGDGVMATQREVEFEWIGGLWTARARSCRPQRAASRVRVDLGRANDETEPKTSPEELLAAAHAVLRDAARVTG